MNPYSIVRSWLRDPAYRAAVVPSSAVALIIVTIVAALAALGAPA